MDGDAQGFTLQRHDEGYPLFLSIDLNPKGPGPGAWWTTDPKQALSFTRKLHAQRFLEVYQAHMISLTQVVPTPRVPA